MIIVWEHDHISPHVVHNHCEPLEHGSMDWNVASMDSLGRCVKFSYSLW
jgi:hypothetical protein